MLAQTALLLLERESEAHLEDKVRTGRECCCCSPHVCAGEAGGAQNESASAGLVTRYPKLICGCESCVCLFSVIPAIVVGILSFKGRSCLCDSVDRCNWY